jgi:ribosomal protein S27E
MENKGLTYSLLCGSIAAGLVCIWRINSGAPTAKESLLLAFLLTICTTVASLLITQYYAEKSSRRELRTFAKKAAEKVTNLSKQMDVLSVSLQQELDDTDFESPKEALLARDMTIESTIRMIGTLKSVNDGSLSDWQGVIGQEITAQRQEREKQEDDLRVIVEKLNALGAGVSKSVHMDDEEDGAGALRHEVDDIKRNVRLLAAQVGGLPVPRAKAKSPKEQVELACPNCGASVSYRQRARASSLKVVKCPKCEKSLYPRFSQDGFVLSQKAEEPLEVPCPGCKTALQIELGVLSGSSRQIECPQCSRIVQARRQNDGVSLAFLDENPDADTSISEDLIRRVLEAMPPQPWPDGTATAVAKQIGISKAKMTSVVSELIRRGKFKHQIDGVLYVPIDEGPPRSGAA